MADNKLIRGPHDPHFISFNDRRERARACRRYRIDELHLALLMQNVGSGRKRIEDLLADARFMVEQVSPPKMKNAMVPAKRAAARRRRARR